MEVSRENVFIGPSVREVFEQLVPDSWNQPGTVMFLTVIINSGVL